MGIACKHFVIPANAGILVFKARDSGFRGSDGTPNRRKEVKYVIPSVRAGIRARAGAGDSL